MSLRRENRQSKNRLLASRRQRRRLKRKSRPQVPEFGAGSGAAACVACVVVSGARSRIWRRSRRRLCGIELLVPLARERDARGRDRLALGEARAVDRLLHRAPREPELVFVHVRGHDRDQLRKALVRHVEAEDGLQDHVVARERVEPAARRNGRTVEHHARRPERVARERIERGLRVEDAGGLGVVGQRDHGTRGGLEPVAELDQRLGHEVRRRIRRRAQQVERGLRPP